MTADLAAEIDDVAHLTGAFLLRSGAAASEYFDKYRFEARPDLLRRIAVEMTALIPDDTEVLAGLELGGVPIVTAISLHTGLPAAFVRKAAKPYGTRRLAEGCEVAGKRVLVVEDVVFSGGQVALSAADLRALGADITTAVCVIDRQSGGRDALAGIGLDLRALFTRSELG